MIPLPWLLLGVGAQGAMACAPLGGFCPARCAWGGDASCPPRGSGGCRESSPLFCRGSAPAGATYPWGARRGTRPRCRCRGRGSRGGTGAACPREVPAGTASGRAACPVPGSADDCWDEPRRTALWQQRWGGFVGFGVGVRCRGSVPGFGAGFGAGAVSGCWCGAGEAQRGSGAARAKFKAVPDVGTDPPFPRRAGGCGVPG